MPYDEWMTTRSTILNYILLIYGVFNDTVSSSPIKWQAISANELEKMWTVIIMAQFEVGLLTMPGRTE